MREAKTKKAEYQHVSVLKDEVLEFLNLKGKRNIVDLTLGLGGHSKSILEIIPKSGKVIGFDLDKDHLQVAKKKLKEFGDRLITVNANFETLAENLKKLKIKAVDAILLDLGIASPHVDIGERGFSFMRAGPLDMRFDLKSDLTAADVVNKYSEKQLIKVFQEYGEEPRARKIAVAIVKARKEKSFKTTLQLADFIEKIMKREGRIHPATRIFQALRIEVNRELEVLNSVLEQATDVLKSGGRLVVISYHSLEDRIVKNFFRENTRDYVNLPGEMTTTKLIPRLKIITKKPLVPGEKELQVNPRSRSAKLRVAEKI